MQRREIIKESDSPWSSSVLLVRKKNADLRFGLDYRKLNDVTKKDGFPMSRIYDTLNMLAGAKWFSTLNLRSIYWQVDLHADDKEKTTFSTGQGLWQFMVMPFGLSNTPTTFERLMETILRDLTYKSCPVYLDDVIMTGRTFEEHQLNLRKVFARFRGARLKLNLENCQHFQGEVRYLGHTVSREGIITNPEKPEAVQEWLIPKNKHKIRSFLGLCTYYRWFISGFTNIVKLMIKLLEKKQAFQWPPGVETAIETL
jgi:hypothetical protein